MKRDFDLIRKLLIYFEVKNNYAQIIVPPIEGYDSTSIQYHLLLMAQAGLIDYEKETTDTGRIISVIPFNLTWEGHEFLSNIKDDNLWEKVKQRLSGKGVNLALELIKQVSIQLINAQLKF